MRKREKHKCLLRLADRLEELDPKHFDLNFWGRPKRGWEFPSGEVELTECRTVGCAAGWAAQWFPELGLTLRNVNIVSAKYVFLEHLPSGKIAEDAVAHAFGLSPTVANHIFLPSHYRAGHHRSKDVALRIRAMFKQEWLGINATEVDEFAFCGFCTSGVPFIDDSLG